MGTNSKHPSLRITRKDPMDTPQGGQRIGGTGSSSPFPFSGTSPVIVDKGGTFFLSLFGGEDRCARVCNNLNEGSVLVDLAHSPGNGLTKKSQQREILNFIKRGKVSGVGLEICCVTWSRARRAPPWSSFPSAVRPPKSAWPSSL